MKTFFLFSAFLLLGLSPLRALSDPYKAVGIEAILTQ
jgi:hypothetical protein